MGLMVAVFVGVAPGYFLSRSLVPATGVVERLFYSTALSVALVPALALGLARLLGSGVTISISVAAPLILVCVGFVALVVFGSAEGKDEPLVPSTATVSPPVFVPLAVAGLLMVVSALEFAPLTWTAPLTLILIVVAGALHLRSAHWNEGVAATEEPSGEPYVGASYVELPIVRRAALAVVFGIVLVKGYVGPILNDWPFIRGVDHYSHAVMANLMMERGQIDPYLIYPPGFHTLTAITSRLSSLDPLELFPVLGPALLLLPTLAVYVLGRRLFGTWAGILAAFFLSMSGGTYQYFEDAMYPNLVTSQFLLVAGITGLVSFYKTPTTRSGAFLVLVGSSVTLFHPVASLYLAMLLGVVGLFLLPYLLLRRRSDGVALFITLAALGILAAVYAWDTYGLPSVIAGVFGDSSKSQTGEAVGMAVGTQMPYRYEALIGYILSQPVAWLGLFGLYVLVGIRDRMDFSGSTLAGKLARLTILLWTFLLLAGSFTPMNGFPQRFARDLGVPLSLLAAFGALVLARSLAPLLLNRQRSTARPVTIFAASLTALGLGMVIFVQVHTSLSDATGPSEQLTITAPIGEAGEWLEENNEGGNILISPHGNQVPSRMMLAMGDYFEYQSFENYQILRPRDLPPTGTKPLWDVYFASHNPTDPHTQDILRDRDIRYVVLYKNMPDRNIKELWTPFKEHPDMYSVAFENSDVLIAEPSVSSK